MAPPTSRKGVQNDIGVINYYRNMWPRRSNTLAYLTKLKSIKRKFKWTKVEKYAFDEIKRVMARDTLLTYPYLNGTFKIHTYASAFHVGAVISQKGKPISF